jgi:hypothetical protein
MFMTVGTPASSTPIIRLVFPVRRNEPVVAIFVNRNPAEISASVRMSVSSSWTMAKISFTGVLLQQASFGLATSPAVPTESL